MYIVHRERNPSNLLSFLCVFLVCVITVSKWYYSFSPSSVEISPTKLIDVVPPFFSFISPPPIRFFAPGRDVSCERTNEILERFWAGRKSSWKTWQREVFLVCLVAELKRERGAKVGNRKRKKKRRKGREVNTLNKNFIKFSVWLLWCVQ